MQADNGKRIGIVTGKSAPELTEDGRAVTAELEWRGYDTRTVWWNETGADWSAFDALLVRSCWKYHEDPSTFRALLRTAERNDVTVVNPPDVIRWNMHKSYVLDLEAAGIPVAPTVPVEQSDDVTLAAVVGNQNWTDVIVKPAIGTSSAGVWRTAVPITDESESRFQDSIAEGDILVQRFLPEVSSSELSFVFFGGEYSHANRTVPRADDFRAHGSHGASSEPYTPARELVLQAHDVLDTAAKLLSRRLSDLPYARVDGVEREGVLTLLELELVEPYLGLSREEGSVEQFVDAVERSISSRVTTGGRA